MDIFPRFSETALAVLISLVTTCLCKSGFSTFLLIKMKSRNCSECTGSNACCYQLGYHRLRHKNKDDQKWTFISIFYI